MRISDWSSDVCSSDLSTALRLSSATLPEAPAFASTGTVGAPAWDTCGGMDWQPASDSAAASRETARIEWRMANRPAAGRSSSLAKSGDRQSPAAAQPSSIARSEEHTSELQSLMRISYAVLCLKKNKHTQPKHT